MGRSRSRSRDRSGERRDSTGRRHSRHKSKDRSGSRDREKYEYEGESKEDRKARRHRKRLEEEGDQSTRGAHDESTYQATGEYGYQAPPGAWGAQGGAPYPEDPQEQRSGHGGEYHQTSQPADSYAQSQFGTGYTPAAGGAEYNQGYQDYSGQSQGYSAEHQSYDTQQQHSEAAGYYQQTSPQPAGHYGPPTEQWGGSAAQYHDQSYAQTGHLAPQPPYPVEPGEDPNRSGQYHDPNYPQGGYAGQQYPGSETPRNPSTHNYQPRPLPSGPPPEAEPDFGFAPVAFARVESASSASAPQWQPTADTQKEKVSFIRGLRTGFHKVLGDITDASTGNKEAHSGKHEGGRCTDDAHFHSDYRFNSFAKPHPGNTIKWFVDGKDYCWAVAEAIQKARRSIWILDWWLSPEMHLKRPAAKYEEFRLDRLLKAAAERGVVVNVIVYKEVTQALTLSSAHTKHYLEGLHPSIQVFRHPDHTPDGAVVVRKVTQFKFRDVFTDFMDPDKLTYYWAHHEKLCLIDGVIPGEGVAFMGGLDLCWGRWDLPHHPISDVHPTDIKQTLFLGQDYNNARVMDFHTVDQWEQNKLKRTESSRMGWSDVALCLSGPTVDDLKLHFMQRWNFILEAKYGVKDTRYRPLSVRMHVNEGHGSSLQDMSLSDATSQLKIGMKNIIGQRGHWNASGERGVSEESQGGKSRRRRGRGGEDYDVDLAWSDSDDDNKKGRRKQERYEEEQVQSRGGYHGGYHQESQHHQQHHQQQYQQGPGQDRHTTFCQIVRSISPWSHNMQTEHSIQNAYIEIISNAQHFIYIENQFFITATDGSRVVKNRIGEALVNRIARAARDGTKFRVIVVMPAVPAFAGDLHDDGALGTRAIMEFQYDSIVRGGKGTSIYEQLHKQGVDPMEYIRFYNLRNYDRINISRELEQAEAQTKFEYEVAQQALENKVGAGWSTAQTQGGELDQWHQAQGNVGASVWDSVAQCSMLGGGDVRDAPWSGDPEKEVDAFVSEQLYIHSKLLIADDKIAICGSANLNDRSQLGDHDSEIAIVVDDKTPLQSLMNGKPYTASHFAATLRRYIFRKHLGLIPAQPADHIDQNSLPVPDPNVYDFDSPEDKLVMDPLSDNFWNHWKTVANTNSGVFDRVFHAVPCDSAHNWTEYTEHYGQYFKPRGTKEKPEPPIYPYGHVIRKNFDPNGATAAWQVKEELAKVRGSLVEMPLKFMQDVDFAKEDLTFNTATEELYT